MTVVVAHTPCQPQQRRAIRVRIGDTDRERLRPARVAAEDQRPEHALRQLEIGGIGLGQPQPVRGRLVAASQRVQSDGRRLKTVRVHRVDGEDLIGRRQDVGCRRAGGALRPDEANVRQHAPRVRAYCFARELEGTLRLAVPQRILTAALWDQFSAGSGEGMCKLLGGGAEIGSARRRQRLRHPVVAHQDEAAGDAHGTAAALHLTEQELVGTHQSSQGLDRGDVDGRIVRHPGLGELITNVAARDDIHVALVRELSDSRADLVGCLTTESRVGARSGGEVRDQQSLARKLRRRLSSLCVRGCGSQDAGQYSKYY